jgi:hypothetical protein
MPTPPLDPALAKECYDAWQRHGGAARMGSKKAAAAELGLNPGTFDSRLLKYRDPALQGAMTRIGTGLVPSLAWVKTGPDEGGVSHSVLLRPPESTPADFLALVREAFDGMALAEPVPPPAVVNADLCNVIPLVDMHLGMLASAKITGEQDYDLKHAATDLEASLDKVLALAPFAEQAIIIFDGDTLHADDDRAETPASKHKIDVDGRQFKVMDVAVHMVCKAVARVQSKHMRTIVRVMRGNHDEHSHLVLTFALAEHFRNDASVIVEKNPRDLFMAQWGRCAIFAHHGDKASPERQTIYLSDVCPFWSETRHRHYYTGHIHKDTVRDFGALRWESLRAFAPPDSYAAGMGYVSRRAIRVDTYHKRDGRKLSAWDPIERHDG